MNSHKESKESSRGDTPLSKGPSSYIVELLKKKPKPLAHYSWKSDWYANREPTPHDMEIKNTTKIEGLWPHWKNSCWRFELLLDFFANSNFNKTFDHRYVAELDFQGQWDLFSLFWGHTCAKSPRWDIFHVQNWAPLDFDFRGATKTAKWTFLQFFLSNACVSQLPTGLVLSSTALILVAIPPLGLTPPIWIHHAPPLQPNVFHIYYLFYGEI